MECIWDAAILQHGDQLPPELLHLMQYGSNERYLEVITRASHDPRLTYLLFAHCEGISAHICASLPNYGSAASTIATLGRIVPFAPYLSIYATDFLTSGRRYLSTLHDDGEISLYMLGLFRLLRHDHKSCKRHVDLTPVNELLKSTSRAVVYLAIRILQICLQCADHWFEGMIKEYLGEDTPDGDINGQWDDKIIDYRFLTLWEEDRYEKMRQLMSSVRAEVAETAAVKRVIPESCFHSATALIGGVLLPRATHADESLSTHTTDLVATSTVSTNIHNTALALKSRQPILLTGLAGSGKTSIARHIASRLGKLDKMITLHLNEQSDAKLLMGIHTTGQTPGSFVWKAGVLTTAVQEGRWVLIEDLDRAPNEIIGALLPLIEKRELHIPSRKQTIQAAEGFRILATVRSTVNHRGEESKPLTHMLGARHWQHVAIVMPSTNEWHDVARRLFSSLDRLLPQMMAVYQRLLVSRQRAVLVGQSKTGVLRPISPRDLLKWCRRVTELLKDHTSFTSSNLDDIFLEAVDCFVGALPEGPARSNLAALIAEELHIDPQRRDYLLSDREARYVIDKSRITVGRYSLLRASALKASLTSSSFSTNPHTSRMLERVAAAVTNREPLLLVGETGVGKTTAVQHLASHMGKKLEPFNLSQQSEAGDLLGGFKPVTARSLVVPLKDEFDELFQMSFSMSKNQQFLELLGKQMARSNWRAVCRLLQQAVKMVDQQRVASPAREGEAPSKKRKTDSRKTPDFARWDAFAARVTALDRQLASGNDSFAFSFVEGNIVKAVRNGDWVLLDEINLASPDTLESIADLLDPKHPSLLLTEAGNVERIDAHPDFRVFAAMNPATDVGKKDLPPGIRSRFTELYVESPDKDIKSLQSIVRSYLRTEATADPAVALDISTLYQQIITLAEQNRLVDGAGQKPHFSLRTLTRTLSYAKYIAPQCNLRRALYEGFQMAFMTFLDADSSREVQPLLEQRLLSKRVNIRAELQKALRKPNDGHQYIQSYPDSKHWVRRGPAEVQEQPHYILTPFIKRNMESLVRAASTRQFPVLIQGPTSSGKTSMIEYLAKRTGHEFVRINNHEHTDLQEYLGTYVSGADGRLSFQEGVLVQALRQGHWIVLDELNLAPTDVLEALNRLLDDNRELLIPETQETVRPHENFMLFATQNPAGLYGGRKTLSRAFRNRFLELHFDDIPIDELEEILHQRTQRPRSWCKRIVTVYRELSVLRQENRLFEQRSFATLRDLFRWALRQNDTVEQLAQNGFMLLAERVRKPDERQALQDIIEKTMRVSINVAELYTTTSSEICAYQSTAESQTVVWTKAMRRLYILVSRAIANNEPVLLVGETGCGKTTVVQMLADALKKNLHTVNAHQNTETGDLIGSQRPVRDRNAIEARLKLLLLSSSLLQDLEMAAALSTDLLLEAYDRAVSTLSSHDKHLYCATQSHFEIQATRTRFRALFEWVDGTLVQAMKDGAFSLLDEISLADDSVLERINSVLESQRSVLLAEKGSLDSFVSATPGFQFFATMNPGGDYGKRELSPALRNRFTEIWVPALSDKEDIVQIVSAKLNQSASQYASAMVAFAQWFRARYNTTATSSVSIRDTLAWVQFINTYTAGHVVEGVVHGAAMVYIDTLGANPAGLMALTGRSLQEERAGCLVELGRLLESDAAAIYSRPIEVATDGRSFTIGPFSIPSKTAADNMPLSFTFEAQTTRRNAMRVVRAMQLSKPVMLEGSPGVGKTALVTAIASAAGGPLTRINLSEQTDLLDLFGSDVPVEGAATGNFAWRDAPFLRAMKNGEWVLLDEMNLASQSVLEGLNACLDHRGEVFVPELGQTFSKHAGFRLFAAQNAHHQGGGRKGLPASFVNRFTVVFADAFSPDDLTLISKRSYPAVDEVILAQAVKFIERLDSEVVQRRRFGATGGPWEFNLRDLSRWLALLTCQKGLLKAGNVRDFVDFLFAQRFRSAADRASVDDLFSSVFTKNTPLRSDLFTSVSPLTVQLGLALLPRHPLEALPWDNLSTSISSPRIEESTMLCIQQAWPAILTGPSGAGKTALIERLASVVGASVATISLNADVDAMDLIGGYEQSDPVRQGLNALAQLRRHIAHLARQGLVEHRGLETLQVLALMDNIDESPNSAAVRKVLAYFEARVQSDETNELLQLVRKMSNPVDKARFEWTDGLLVEALVQGQWLVLDNANLCSASVLDRLNSLLEPGGKLIINEHTEVDGSPRVITPHAAFRVFLTVDPRFGELSRAMRNRAVELYLPASQAHPQSTPNMLQPESSMARIRQYGTVRTISGTSVDPERLALIVSDHMGLCDQPLLSRFSHQLQVGLFDNGPCSSLVTPSSDPKIAKFHTAAVSHAQASADFACVQTFHPLNNQALVQQTPQILVEASKLGFKHDICTRAAALLQRLAMLRANQHAVRHLERLERSHLSTEAAHGVLQTLESLIRSLPRWTEQVFESAISDRWNDAPEPQLAVTWTNIHHPSKLALLRLCAFVDLLLQYLCSPDFEWPVVYAWVSAMTGASMVDPSLPAGFRGALASEVIVATSALRPPVAGIEGLACVPLWRSLKSSAPKTLAEINALLELEAVVDRLDNATSRGALAVSELASMHTSIVRTLHLARSDASSVPRLLEQLEPHLESTLAMAVKPSATPHFAGVFESIYKHMALLSIDAQPFATEDVSITETLALRSPRSSIALVGNHLPRTPAEYLFLLGCSLDQDVAEKDEHRPEQWHQALFKSLATSNNVRLADMKLFQAESSELSRIIAGRADRLCVHTSALIDSFLRRLLDVFLDALAELKDNLGLQNLSSVVRDELSKGSPAPTSSHLSTGQSVTMGSVGWLKIQLDVVACHLVGSYQSEEDWSASASFAWAALALAGLVLYIAKEPFDPALQPRIERKAHEICCQDLVGQLVALGAFRTCINGENRPLRAQLLEQDIKELGPPPLVEEIYRPEVSELTQLQSEFDSAMRAIQPLQQDLFQASMARVNDGVMWSNLERIRTRLTQQYRAYTDLTGPIIGFIDCLRLSRQLGARKATQADTEPSVRGVIPFVSGSLQSWLGDDVFIQAFDAELSQQEMLCLLSALAARCTVRPLVQATATLRGHAADAFMRLYSQWKTRLSQEQRRAAAKSSLYRYSGDTDLVDEDSPEEVNKLFPSYETDNSAPIDVNRNTEDFQLLAPRVTELHNAVFRPGREDQDHLWALLQQFADLASGLPLGHESSSYVPAALRSLQTLSEKRFDSGRTRESYNIYTDSNSEQATKLVDTLSTIQRRFRDLHNAWPEHATPTEVLRQCDQLLDFGHAEPLVRYLPPVEKLHATLNEWQQIASRDYSVSNVLEELTSLIVSWRQLELSSWSGLLDRENDACTKDASSWWYIAYETIIAASQDMTVRLPEIRMHAQELLTTLEGFLANCGIGEFGPRLQMLKSFSSQLAVDALNQPCLHAIQQALQNTIAYHENFEPLIGERLVKGRAELETQIKNVIQVASWKDRNIETLKQSAKSSHKKLLRLVKKYRALLGQPVAPMLQSGVPLKQDPSNSPTCHTPQPQSDNWLQQSTVDHYANIQTWQARPDRFKNITATAALMREKVGGARDLDAPTRLRDFLEELTDGIIGLQKATPGTLTEENKTLVQHLKTRKRRLLADTLKNLRSMGLQTNLGDDALSRQAATHIILASTPALSVIPEKFQVCAAEHHFHRLIGIMPAVREGARKHSEDLTPAEVSRGMALLESLLQTSLAQRRDLSVHLNGQAKLNRVMQQLDAFASSIDPFVQDDSSRSLSTTRYVIKPLRMVVATCARLVETQQDLASIEYTGIVGRLRELTYKLESLEQDVDKQPAMPEEIGCQSLVLLEASLNGVEADIEELLRSAAETHPELMPVLSQLSYWLRRSAKSTHLTQTNGRITKEVSTWSEELLRALDDVLGSVEALERAASLKPGRENEKAWLVQQSRDADNRLKELRVDGFATKFDSLLHDLAHVTSGFGSGLVAASAMCRAVWPILQVFTMTTEELVTRLCALHVETNRIGFQLATSFLHLTQQGFCAPPEKAANDSQKSGKVEGGTGLGEGEATDDISKDVGDDEDLSELAQDTKAEAREEGIEEEKDAVDMADAEMEGELGSDGEEGSDDASDAGEKESPAEEEAGSVDDLGQSTVDEKMWDKGGSDDRTDRQADNVDGSKENEDIAAKEETSDGKDDGDEEEVPAACTEQSEEVTRQEPEKLDSHIDEQQTLDLPEDIAMDVKEDGEAIDSDMDMLADSGDKDPRVAEGEEDLPDQDEEVDKQPGDDDANEGMEDDALEKDQHHDGQADDDVSQSDDDDGSDVLMQDGEANDAFQDDAVYGETGAGIDQDPVQAEPSHAAEDVVQDQDETEGISGKSLESEATASGTQQGTQTERETGQDRETQQKESSIPYRRIGDVLDEWYKQHQHIEDPQQTDEAAPDQPAEMDLSNARFEHLPNDGAEADTQALGAASVDQAHALDEEKELAHNEHEANDTFIDNDASETTDEKDQSATEQRQLDPHDTIGPERMKDAFVGEHGDADKDVDMPDELDKDDEVNRIDRQMTDTSLSTTPASYLISMDEARVLWSEHEAGTRNLALVLTEHLRLILQPTQATKMRGDFRTGKRLNIKRIIPYIASSYKRDKIWMRRSVPSKRSYQIMLAIDDSKSMAESESRDLAFQTLALVAKSMSMLEVGELGVVGFGEDVTVAHDFNVPFTTDAGAAVFRHFNFAQSKTNVRKLLVESIELFRAARLKAIGSASDLWQLQLIISDGVCDDHSAIRQLVRQAQEERIMVVFIVVDAAAKKAQEIGGPKESILNLTRAEFVKDAAGESQLNMVKYLDTFPFKYYLIVRDVPELPGVLAGALRQWFAEVVETG